MATAVTYEREGVPCVSDSVEVGVRRVPPCRKLAASSLPCECSNTWQQQFHGQQLLDLHALLDLSADVGGVIHSQGANQGGICMNEHVDQRRIRCLTYVAPGLVTKKRDVVREWEAT